MNDNYDKICKYAAKCKSEAHFKYKIKKALLYKNEIKMILFEKDELLPIDRSQSASQ